MARVFLHVGTMKSGTSYLQQICDSNQAALEAHGIDWYGITPTNRAVQDLLRSKRLSPEFEGAWERLAERIRQSDRDTLISMEMLGAASLNKIRTLAKSLNPHELRLIVTIRDLTLVLPSHWQELTRNRFEEDWNNYCERICGALKDAGPSGSRFWRHYNLIELIRRWSEVIPEQRMSLVTVPGKDLEPDLLWSRFASVTGLPTSGLITPGRHVNFSMGAVSAELMRRINNETGDLDWRVYQRGFKHALSLEALNARAKDEPRLRLSPVHYQALRDWTVETVRFIDDSKVSVVGDLEEIMPSDPPPSNGSIPEPVTDEQLLAAAIDGLVGLGRLHGELSTEYDALICQLAELRSTPPSRPGRAFVRRALLSVRELRRRLRR